ncbi:hypothetical protein [Paenibacillus spongiae]|uniref:SigmaY antisigma factor component n=1 Tax=Paenibacillus spongiae TaxID=2909671 RepID=A0ABY5SCQ2_9BACL|nr:hypothetical protein [Paenibacillus spongiae]UVI31328.1 hypothetical protein L1F29_05655 [Paenibacillus spongiae]
MDELKGVPVWLLILLVIVLLCQSTWLFIDARKHSRFPWFWGLWGLIQVPMPFILYWLVVRVDWKKFGKSRRK